MWNLTKIILIILLNIFLLSGCTTIENDFNEELNEPDNILTIGVNDKFPPLTYLDNDKNYEGFDIDLANEVAKRLGMELRAEPIDWSNLENELNSGNIDAVWSGLTITPERQTEMLFTDPYLENEQVLVVPNGSDITSINDLVEKRVGTQVNSTSEEILKENPVVNELKDFVTYQESSSALDDLSVGKIDAAIVDSTLAQWYLENKNNELVILEEPLSYEYYGVAVANNNEQLLQQLNEALNEVKADGSGAEISTRWFGQDLLVYPNY